MQGQHRSEEAISEAEARDLGEDTLRAPHHHPGLDVVFGGMPGADEASIAIDRAIGEIGEEMSAPPGNGKQLLLRIPDRIAAGAFDRPRRQSPTGPTSISATINLQAT